MLIQIISANMNKLRISRSPHSCLQSPSWRIADLYLWLHFIPDFSPSISQNTLLLHLLEFYILLFGQRVFPHSVHLQKDLSLFCLKEKFQCIPSANHFFRSPSVITSLKTRLDQIPLINSLRVHISILNTEKL